MTDSFLAKGKRKKLVEELRRKGITDEEVLRAINAVPRHDFMDPAFLNHAYTDKAFPISAGQTISQNQKAQDVNALAVGALIRIA